LASQKNNNGDYQQKPAGGCAARWANTNNGETHDLSRTNCRTAGSLDHLSGSAKPTQFYLSSTALPKGEPT